MNDAFYIIPKMGGIAYLNMPKAACTSVLRALSMMRHDEHYITPTEKLADGSDPIHGFHPSYAHTEYFFGRWPINYPPLPVTLTRFTFVRNPYARFYSFYKSKIKLCQAPGSYYKKFGLNKRSSFAKCVRTITSIAPEELEHHALPQSMIALAGDAVMIDYYGKLENSAKDWHVIQQLSGFEMPLGENNATSSSSRPVYTEELKQRIYEYYRDDFILFEYDRDDVRLRAGAVHGNVDEVYTGHLRSEADIEKLKISLNETCSTVMSLASELESQPGLRATILREQGNGFMELLQKRLVVTNNIVSELKQQSLQLSQRVSKVASKADNIEKSNVRWFDKQFRVLESHSKKISNHVARIDAQAERIDANDAQAERIDAQAERIDAQAERIDAQAERIDAQAERIDANDAQAERIDALAETTKSLDKDRGNLNALTNVLQKKTDEFGLRAQEILAKVDDNRKLATDSIRALRDVTVQLDTKAAEDEKRSQKIIHNVSVNQDRVKALQSESKRLDQQLLEMKKALQTERSRHERGQRAFNTFCSGVEKHMLSLYARNRRSYYRRICRLFENGWQSEFKLLYNAGLVDPYFYFIKYPDVRRAGISATRHYLYSGALEGRDPSREFSTVRYIMANPEVAYSGVNPLVHSLLK